MNFDPRNLRVESNHTLPTDTYARPSAEAAPTASQVTVVHDPRPRQPSLASTLSPRPDLTTPSSQPTVIPYAPTPPSAPSFNLFPSSSESEIYGPERLFGHVQTTPEHVDTAVSLASPPSLRFVEPQFPMAVTRDPLMGRDFKDDLARAAGMVTPGVDDGPYIRYALDALTRVREDDRGTSEDPSSEGRSVYFKSQSVPHQPELSIRQPPISSSSRNVRSSPSLRVPDMNLSPSPPPRAEDDVRTRRERRKEMRGSRSVPVIASPFDYDNAPLPTFQQRPPSVEYNPPRTVDTWKARPDASHLADPEKGERRTPPLMYKPWILRPQSLITFATLCILMITALVFSAIYSIGRNGFTAYDDTIYGGKYFVFRILPQFLGAVLLFYGQSILAAAFRVLPFSVMASDDRHERRNAVFLPLYPKSFLWPQLYGSWHVWIPALNVWLLNITLPLLSGLFTVVIVDGVWTWSTVQGVAWTLVALYVSLLFSVVVLFLYWHKRRTGMMLRWDLRTLADILFLVSQSNSLPQYLGLEVAAARRDMRSVLDGSAERLGFWTTTENSKNQLCYGIGLPTAHDELEMEKFDGQDWAEKRRRHPEDPRSGTSDAQTRYLPWCFRDGQIIFFAVAATILLVALIVVSFVQSTDLRNGFIPLLSAGPVPGAFSPADFLYSFLPSLLGLLLFLAFQSLDLTLRIMAPWGELACPEGAPADSSLLLDYAACLPWESTIKAIRHKHWRVAFVTFLSPLFVLLPVLGGGLFMALTPRDGVVRVYPNVPVFAIILTLLVLYVIALFSLVPDRRRFRLPHAVTCLAEIISFCRNEQASTCQAFESPSVGEPRGRRSRHELGRGWTRQSRWTFGRGPTQSERLGIKRHAKYTANPRATRGRLISLPLPRYSGERFGR